MDECVQSTQFLSSAGKWKSHLSRSAVRLCSSPSSHVSQRDAISFLPSAAVTRNKEANAVDNVSDGFLPFFSFYSPLHPLDPNVKEHDKGRGLKWSRRFNHVLRDGAAVHWNVSEQTCVKGSIVSYHKCAQRFLVSRLGSLSLSFSLSVAHTRSCSSFRLVLRLRSKWLEGPTWARRCGAESHRGWCATKPNRFRLPGGFPIPWEGSHIS